jgi:hypothetical protein
MKKHGSVLFLLFLSTIGFGQTQRYSKQDILEDLNSLQSQLEEKHPNIGIYTDKKDFNYFFQNVVIPDSLSAIEAYSLITSSNKVIKDGHTLFYPNKEYINNNNQKGLFLPIQPYWNGEKLFVLHNYSQVQELKEGVEILSINGVASKSLICEMLDKMMRDGNNFNYPIWVLNRYFYEYYSYFHGCSNEYHLRLNDDSDEKTLVLKGYSKPELFKQINDTKTKDKIGIYIEINNQTSTAILTIKDWHDTVLRKYYKQKFIPEIKEVFQKLKNNNIDNLIIDVRNNQGGDTKNSKFLLSYLLQAPFSLVEEYNRNKNGKLTKSKGPQMGIHQSITTPFKGDIYVLINGGSFSNTGIFCSVLKKENRATFVGEETGGSEFVICSNPKRIKLANTGIIIELPTLQFMIKPYTKEDLHGIIPNLKVKPSIESLIKGEDKVIELTLNMIKENSIQ